MPGLRRGAAEPGAGRAARCPAVRRLRQPHPPAFRCRPGARSAASASGVSQRLKATFSLEKTMKKLIAAVVLLTASAGAFAAAPAVAQAMTDCACPCPDCPDGK